MFQGATDSEVFEDFIEQLLCHCSKWPEPNSVLVMDNAAFHHLERIEQMCNEAGVKLVYLPPYSPDLNPIEEFFWPNYLLQEVAAMRTPRSGLRSCIDNM